jgi:hypothetical protein
MNAKRTSAFFMANLGSEATRIMSAREHNNQTEMSSCYERALKILKEIISLPDMNTRAIEIKILSDLIHDMASSNPRLHVSRKNLSSYFTPFALRVMNSH